jgi:predicted DNA-binding transcriptional regulator AlpA
MLTNLLRFSGLRERGIVRSWPQLARLQKNEGFPAGFLLSQNSRAWAEDEVAAWLAARPRERRAVLKGAAKPGAVVRRKRKPESVQPAGA